MAATFTVISCVQGYYVYKDIRDPGVGETLNCKSEVRNPKDPYAVSVSTTVGHVRTTCHLMHMYIIFKELCCL